MTGLDPRAEEAWHTRGAHASDDADHDEALERQDREREKQDEPRAWGRCQACYCYGYRKQTRRGLVCYRCR